MKSKLIEKRIVLSSMVFLLVVLPLLGAQTKAQAPAKPIELKFNTQLPARAWAAVDEWAPWVRRVEQRCKGRVKIPVFWGSTLSSPMDAYDSAVKGIAEIVWGPHAYYPGRFPMMSVLALPGVVGTMAAGNRIIYDVYQKFPEIEKEHKGVKVLWLGTAVYALQIAKRPVRTLEDLKGLRLRVPGEMAETFKMWGAAPIMMPTPEAYHALEKGVIDGVCFDWNVVEAFKVHEVTKYATIGAPLPGGSLFLVMNIKKWNSLPSDIQKIFVEEGKRHWMEFCSESDKHSRDVVKRFQSVADREVIYLPPAERERWLKQVKPIHGKWVADMEAKGLPGKAFHNEVLRLAEKYNAMYPWPK